MHQFVELEIQKKGRNRRIIIYRTILETGFYRFPTKSSLKPFKYFKINRRTPSLILCSNSYTNFKIQNRKLFLGVKFPEIFWERAPKPSLVLKTLLFTTFLQQVRQRYENSTKNKLYLGFVWKFMSKIFGLGVLKRVKKTAFRTKISKKFLGEDPQSPF